MTRTAWTTALVLVTLAALAMIWLFLEAVVIFLLALTLSVVLKPAVEALQRRGLSRSAASGLVYVALLLAATVAALPVGNLMMVELQEAVGDFGTAYEHIDHHWAQGNAMQQLIAQRLPRLEDVPRTLADLPPPVLLSRISGVGQGAMGLLINLTVVYVLSFYWTLDSQRFERLWLSLLPLERRTRAQAAWQEIETEVGAYMRSELVQCLIAGVVLAGILHLLGFPYPMTIAIIAALAWLVPWLGPAVAVAVVWLASAMAFADVTPAANLARSVVGSLVVLTVFAVLELLVEPRLVDRRKYSSLWVVMVVVALMDLMGLVGLILGPPVALAVQIAAGHYLWQPTAPASPTPIADLSVLRQRVAEVRDKFAGLDEESTRRMENLLDRLNSLLDEAGAAAAESYGAQRRTRA